MSYDVRVRTGEILRKENLVPEVVEIEEGWNVAGKDWQLSAFRVEHQPVDEAFGFRFGLPCHAIASCLAGAPLPKFVIHCSGL